MTPQILTRVAAAQTTGPGRPNRIKVPAIPRWIAVAAAAGILLAGIGPAPAMAAGPTAGAAFQSSSLHGPADPGPAESMSIPPPGHPLADGPLVFDTNLGLIERATIQAVEEALQGIAVPEGSDILLHPMTTSEGLWFVEDSIARVLTARGFKVHLTRIEPPAGATGQAPPASTPGGGAGAGSLSDMINSGNTSAAANDSTAPPDSTRTPPPPPPPSEGGPTSTTGPGKPNGQFQAQMQAARAAGAAAQAQGVPVPFPDAAGLVLTYRIVEFGVTYHDSWRRGFMGPRVVERLASVDLYTRLVNGSAENVLWAGRGHSERLDVVPQAKLDLLEGRTYPFTRPVLRNRPLSRLAEPVLVAGIITGLVFLFYSSQN